MVDNRYAEWKRNRSIQRYRYSSVKLHSAPALSVREDWLREERNAQVLQHRVASVTGMFVSGNNCRSDESLTFALRGPNIVDLTSATLTRSPKPNRSGAMLPVSNQDSRDIAAIVGARASSATWAAVPRPTTTAIERQHVPNAQTCWEPFAVAEKCAAEATLR